MDGKVGRSVCCLRHQYLPGCVEHVRSTCVHECVCNRCKVLLLSPLCLACTGQWPACKRCLQEACACAFTSKLTRSCVHTDARNTRIQYIHACPRKAGGHQPDAVWGNVCWSCEVDGKHWCNVGKGGSCLGPGEGALLNTSPAVWPELSACTLYLAAHAVLACCACIPLPPLTSTTGLLSGLSTCSFSLLDVSIQRMLSSRVHCLLGITNKACLSAACRDNCPSCCPGHCVNCCPGHCVNTSCCPGHCVNTSCCPGHCVNTSCCPGCCVNTSCCPGHCVNWCLVPLRL